MKTSLSVLVPVYNEEYLVYESLRRLRILDTSPHLERIEVIVVDDCSTDSSPRIIERFKKETERAQESNIRWIFLRHDRNGSKGTGCQDGARTRNLRDLCHPRRDLEYHAKDLLRIVE